MRQVAGHAIWLGHAGDLRDAHAVLTIGVEAIVELADSEQLAELPRELIRFRFPLSDAGMNELWLLRFAAEAVAALLRANVPTLSLLLGRYEPLGVCCCRWRLALERRPLPEAHGPGRRCRPSRRIARLAGSISSCVERVGRVPPSPTLALPRTAATGAGLPGR